MHLVIGIDGGTTGTKGVAAGADTSVYASAEVSYKLQIPEARHAELDAAELQRATVETLREIVRRLEGSGHHVAGVCLSAAMHGLLPFAEDNSPQGPVVTWADTRADDEARRLRADPSAGDLHARTGTPLHPMSPLTKLMWTATHDPELHRSTPRWGGVKELLIAALVDAELTIDLSCASATGLYDIHQGRWDPEALERAGVDEARLARVVPTTGIVGPLRPDVARAVGLPEGTPVIAGASDGTLANLGVGAVVEGYAALSVGTSGALRAVRSTPGIDQAGRLFCYALTENKWVVGAAVSNGASVLDWLSEALGAPPGHDVGALLAEAEQVAPGSAGLLCLPYLLGERAPWWRSGLHGAYVGLRRDHGRGHLVRAAVEGVAQQLALILAAVKEAGVDVTEIRATGGALASSLWSTVLASALELPLRQAPSSEGTAVGAALLGHHALGALADLDEVAGLVTLERETAPDPRAAQIYGAMRPLIERAVAGLDEVFAALDELPSESTGEVP
ncbi:MAG TPA: gluconokinase [Jiangellaceae bacterium]